MSTLHDIQRQIVSMDELGDVIGAMRALAGMRLQEAEQALPGIRRYAQAMGSAVHAAAQLGADGVGTDHLARGAGAGRRALILCAAEHGFVGGFNERLLDAVRPQLGVGDELYVLGSRGASLALERGWHIGWTHPMATRLAGVPETVDRLSERLLTDIGSGRILRVDAWFASVRPGQGVGVRRRALLPLDISTLTSAGAPAAPLHNLPAPALLEGLVAEYVFALLTESAVESLASENAARFAAMDAARDNVTHKLEQLRQGAQQLRQSEITEELLDLMIGTQALEH